jgi:hypothetical protein
MPCVGYKPIKATIVRRLIVRTDAFHNSESAVYCCNTPARILSAMPIPTHDELRGPGYVAPVREFRNG